MKSRLIIISFTIFFFNSAQAICVPRNRSTPSPSPDTPPNLKPVSSSPKAPTPVSKSPSSSPKAPSPVSKSPSSSPKAPTPSSPASKSPSSSPKAPTPSSPSSSPKAPTPSSPSSSPKPPTPSPPASKSSSMSFSPKAPTPSSPASKSSSMSFSPKAPTPSSPASKSSSMSFSPKAPTPSKSPSSSPKAPTPSLPPPKAPSTSSPSPQQSPNPVSILDSSPSKPDQSILNQPILNTITSALPKPGGGGNNPGIKKICDSTDYPDVCLTTLGPLSGPANDVSAVLGVAIKAGSTFAKTALNTADKLAGAPGTPPDLASLIKDCKDSYDDVSYNFQNAAEALPKKDVGTMNTMLSAALTDVGDCQDAFEGQDSPLTTVSETLRKMASNCLAIVDQMNK